MRLDTLTLEQCELVRQWRNAPDVLPMLRTREPLSEEQQAAFYRDVVCNPASNHRYYALIATRLGYDSDLEPTRRDVFVGMGGLTYLDRVPGEGEISLILGPDFRRDGHGTRAAHALRAEAAQLGLTWVVGEVYNRNPARAFWAKHMLRAGGEWESDRDRFFFRIRVS
jgi:RimJ/RimL family protein N-acetyltransferase